MTYFLTTLDNPYNPATHYDEWYNYDIRKGYDSCGRLARIAPSSNDQLPEEYTDSLVEIAMDSIIDLMPNLYTKVSTELTDEEFAKLYKENLKKFKEFANAGAY